MKKLHLVVFVLAAALIATTASSSLLGAEPRRRPGGARHEPRHWAPRDATNAATGNADWSTVRVVLTARLTEAELAREARRRVREERRRPHPVTFRLCRRYQHVMAFDAHGAGLVVRNDNYGGLRECLANLNRRANFAVALSAARRAGPEPAAFPNIFYGCSWGVCSPRTRLPRRLSHLRHPVTSWYTAGHPKGRWDAAYDIWFAKQRATGGQDRGAEIMLWLRTDGLGRPTSAHSLLIDRRRWQLEHWITRNPATGDHWPLIIFWMTHPRRYVRHLALMPFFRRAEALGLLHRSFWLTSVEAGFEVWRGGTGLRTTSFSVRP